MVTRQVRWIPKAPRDTELDDLLCDAAAPPLDGAAGGLLVLRHHVAHLLRVELLGERRRADEVAEEDGELAALARGTAASASGVGVGAPGAGAALGSRAPQPPQNFSPASAGAPHEGHAIESVAPHSVQKRRSGRLSWLQDGQRIAACLASGDYHAGAQTLKRCTRGAVSRPKARESAPVPACGTRPWRDTSRPGPATHPGPPTGTRSTTIANTSLNHGLGRFRRRP